MQAISCYHSLPQNTCIFVINQFDLSVYHHIAFVLVNLYNCCHSIYDPWF